MELWKREAGFLASGAGEYRHGASFVAVSDIASQYYCEYKAENEHTLGEIPTELKEMGTALHEELVPQERVSAKEFVRLVSGREPSLAVLKVWGTVAGLRVVGIPDHIIWSRGRPLWLVELKTTMGDPEPLWEDQESQARIYGLLLDLMGLDCSVLRLAVVRVKATGMLDEEKAKWAAEVSSALLGGTVAKLEMKYSGRLKVHLLDHDRRKAVSAVVAKAGYWLGERRPTSSSSVGKCRACEFNEVCPKSLLKHAAGTAR